MPRVSFYVAAHQDDWQLFRGEQAYIDLNTPDMRVVFIYTTAGDAARTDGWWEAREQGALASVRRAIPVSPLTISVASFNNHPITAYACGNSKSYCMRLPDGKRGVAACLSALRDQEINSLATVDGSTTYAGWGDFVATLEAIVRTETRDSSSPNPWLNAADYDPRLAPGDHPDHQATGEALKQFAGSFCSRAWWASYDVKNRPVNLERYDNQRALFFAYADTVFTLTARNGKAEPPNVKEAEWDRWRGRNYCRLVPFGEPDH